jgi:hypothetical protein
MDLICPKCREPWDADELHEVVGMTYREARNTFTSEGCGPVFQTSCSGEVDPLVSEVYALLGDDLDGAIAMLDDARFLGLLG